MAPAVRNGENDARLSEEMRTGEAALKDYRALPTEKPFGVPLSSCIHFAVATHDQSQLEKALEADRVRDRSHKPYPSFCLAGSSCRELPLLRVQSPTSESSNFQSLPVRQENGSLVSSQ